jgi:hypothetical protein
MDLAIDNSINQSINLLYVEKSLTNLAELHGIVALIIAMTGIASVNDVGYFIDLGIECEDRYMEQGLQSL